MKIKKIVIFSFLALLIITGCGNKENKEQSEEITKTEKTEELNPKFEFTTVTDKQITITADQDGWKFKGMGDKTILLTFFGTWCPPCKAEIPHLNNIRQKLEKDFEILAVDIGPRGGGYNTKEHLNDFIKKFDIKYPIVSGEKARQLFSTVNELNPSGSIPFMVLFNKKGEYVKYYIGMTPEEMLFNDISTTIKMK